MQGRSGYLGGAVVVGADPGPTPAVVVVGGVAAGTDSGGANGAGVGSVGDVGLVVSVGEGVVVSVVVVVGVVVVMVSLGRRTFVRGTQV